ncbi:MAG TPA: nucleotidyltransferase domain-containing protein [Thermoleophilaceae bacterium]|nr:nucleotidyltransferase domain-containing protein [Thermoleophilaceae bacterium]
MLRQEEIDELVGQIVARIEPQKVILFGSYAKGTATIRSDVDLLVIKETELPIARRTDDLRPLLSRSLIPVDVHVYTPEEVEEYGKDPMAFINSVLKSGRTVFSSELASVVS